MSYSIIPSLDFLKKAKEHSKKYLSFKVDLENLCSYLSENPRTENQIGDNYYIINMPISSNRFGKFGGRGTRIFTKIVYETIYLITVYDGKEWNEELNELLKEAGIE
jgi:hypothetical protein